MAKFTVDISDKMLLAGISAAAEAAGAESPAAYVQTIVESAAASYAKQHGFDEVELSALEADVAARRAKLEAAK